MIRPRSQVVRQRSAKPLFASSILAAASKLNNAGVVEWYTRIIC